ncbi:MAG TPA: DUF2490 domain-containing protein [Chryseosolibacter sp.]
MKKRVLAAILIAVVFVDTGVSAQSEKNVTTQRLIWLGYNNKFRITNRWMLVTEIEDRRYAFPDRQNEWILPRVTVLRDVGSGWNAGIGFAHFRQSSPDNQEVDIAYVRPELRPHVEANYAQKPGAGKLSMDHRYKLEGRFIHRTSSAGLEDGYTFNIRLRYRIQLSYPLIKKESAPGTLLAKAYNEFMVNFGKHILYNSFDQNRLGIALNYGLRKDLQLQADFVHIFKERTSGEYLNQYVERFTIYHTINRIKN